MNEEVQKWRGTPEYSTGYFDGVEDRAAIEVHPGYLAGHAAGARAVALFKDNGFGRTGSRRFGRKL